MPKNNNQDEKLLPIFEAPARKTIATDKGIVSVNEFSEEEGFVWCDAPVGPFDARQYVADNRERVEERLLRSQLKQALIDKGMLLTGEMTPSVAEMLTILGYTKAQVIKAIREEEKEIAEALSTPINELTIRTINKLVGKGVFLTPGSKPIERGKIVCIYSGEYQKLDHNKRFYPYAVSLPESFIFAKTFGSLPVNGDVDAEYYGNIGRYFNDMPTKEELKDWYNVNPKIADEIATANLELMTGYYQLCPIAYLSAAEKITRGQLGFSFGGGYWARAECLMGIERCLFKKDGTVVNKEDYQRRFLNLEFNAKEGQQKDYYPIKINEIKRYLLSGNNIDFYNAVSSKKVIIKTDGLVSAVAKRLFKTDDCTDENFHKIRFCVTIRVILLDFLVENAYVNNDFAKQKVSYVKELQKSVASLAFDDADETFKSLSAVLNNEHIKKFYIDNLSTLRCEISSAMNSYIKAKFAQQNAPTASLAKSAKKLAI